MKRFFLKIATYTLLILLVAEGLVRAFHLHKGTPTRMIDEKGVEKWVPGQTGHVTTGNRRQNYAEYRINNLGFNSYREFEPETESYEVALIGDSFIEGFHQDYDKSLGKKIEDRLPEVAVYEFGYAGYDLADELHLLQSYPDLFARIDKLFIYVHYPDDLFRGKHEVSQERMKLQRGYFALLQKSKLIVYLQNIGFITSMTNELLSWKKSVTGKKRVKSSASEKEEQEKQQEVFKNFKQLIRSADLDWNKATLLLDEDSFPQSFTDFLNVSGIPYLDYGKVLQGREVPVTLIYDKHWNDFGRELVASQIANYLKTQDKNFKQARVDSSQQRLPSS